MTHSEYWDRIAANADRARRVRERFEPPEDPPDEQRALEFLREGLGPLVATYVEARTGGGEQVAFSEVEFTLLQRALNDWLELYARCYGVTLDAEFTVREAAELLVETHNVRDVARMLTKVPGRNE
jgi:hypothetical protein